MSEPCVYPSLNFGLGETVDLLREQVARFSVKEIAPLASAIDESNEFPSHLWEAMGGVGLLGITVEEEYGRQLYGVSCSCYCHGRD